MKNLIQLFLVIISILLINPIVNAQFSCGNTGISNGAYNRSTTCDVDLNSFPIKTVRITFHVFQKDNGTENIPNSTAGIDYLWLMGNHASSFMGDLDPMLQPSPSPYFQDSKIRFEAVGYYFWQNTTMWSKANYWIKQNLTDMYNFVMSQNINNKYTSIHILIPGDNPNNSNLGGRACNIGCNQSLMLSNTYSQFLNNNFWNSGNLLRHELGHCFNLYHSFFNDLCDDTPNHGIDSFSILTNNIMDYNPSNDAMTLDQVSRCHVWLSNNSFVLSSGIQYGNLSITLSNSGNNGPVAGSTINMGSSSGTINVSAPLTDSYTWTYMGGWGSPSYTVLNNGEKVLVSGLGSINLKVTWIENCITYSKQLTFFNGGYYYSINSNPTSGPLYISGDSEKRLTIMLPNGKIAEKAAIISNISLYDISGNLLKHSEVNSFNHRLDMSVYKTGTYKLIIYNKELQLAIEKTVVKI